MGSGHASILQSDSYSCIACVLFVEARRYLCLYLSTHRCIRYVTYAGFPLVVSGFERGAAVRELDEINLHQPRVKRVDGWGSKIVYHRVENRGVWDAVWTAHNPRCMCAHKSRENRCTEPTESDLRTGGREHAPITRPRFLTLFRFSTPAFRIPPVHLEPTLFSRFLISLPRESRIPIIFRDIYFYFLWPPRHFSFLYERLTQRYINIWYGFDFDFDFHITYAFLIYWLSKATWGQR